MADEGIMMGVRDGGKNLLLVFLFAIQDFRFMRAISTFLIEKKIDI